MKVRTKLILLVILIAILAFIGARLTGIAVKFLSGIREIGNAPSAVEDFPVDPTPTPPEFTDQDYDAVQGVPE